MGKGIKWLLTGMAALGVICLMKETPPAAAFFSSAESGKEPTKVWQDEAWEDEEQGNEAQENEAQEVTLTLLYSGADVTWVAAMEELCESFMPEHPNIVIDTQTSDKANCEDELKVKEALDEFPDLFELENVDTFAEAGKLGVLDESLWQMVSDPVRVGEMVYGLPIYATTNGVIYNTNIFKRYGIDVPQSYEEFLEVCRKLQENDVTPLSLGGSQDENLVYWLNFFFQKDVISVLPDWLEKREAGEVSFTDSQPLAMLTEYQELMTSGYILEDSVNMTENQTVTKMVENQFAMLYAGPQLFSRIIDAYPAATESDKTPMGEDIPLEEDPVTYRLGWFFIGNGNGNTTVLTQNSACWAISDECGRDPEKYEAAGEFLKFFYTKENYRAMIQGMNGLPTTTEKIIYPAPSAQQQLLVEYRYATKSQAYLGASGARGDFVSSLNEILRALEQGECSVREAAEWMDEAWDEAVSEEG